MSSSPSPVTPGPVSNQTASSAAASHKSHANHAVLIGLVAVAVLCGAFALYRSQTADPAAGQSGATLFALLSGGLLLAAGFVLWNQMRAEGLRAKQALAALESSYAQISAQSESLAIAKSETGRIMETVQEGLFLVDEKGIIGEYHSKALLAIFKQDELAGYSFFNLLQRLLSEKMFNTTKDYFALLFDASKKEKTVLKVNPLTEIEVNFSNPTGGFLNHYLGFTFRRIMDGDRVARVFVAVRDITKQVELEKKLREAEKHKERQLDILLGIVHVPPTELASFTELVETELENINKTLRAEDFARIGSTNVETLRERLKVVFRSVHNIKGNAALLKLAYFQKAADAFETKIAELLDRPRLSSDDFLAVVIAEASMRDDVVDLQDLRAKLVGLRSFTPGGQAAPITSPVAALASGLQELVEEAARDLEKATTLSLDEFAIHAVSFGRASLIRDVLIQLARNSLAHSVEPPAERVASGKPAVATLSVRGLPSAVDGYVGLAFRDDGRGLNLDAIRNRAIGSKLMTEAEAAKATPAELGRCIFAPGFSTAATAGAHSGRGMGMDIIKSKVVDEAGGILELHSTPGKYCEFRLYFPVSATTAPSA
ncbi:MAG: ATP-binding protein [Opitutaceae bacterium]|jgi:signal transduction histidine kinase|nr:ATP-binding protein [Opitutaceae bacterium]